ncbi:unnamed protein product, partial [Iphiclides podalirius]
MVNVKEISEADAREVRKRWWQSPRAKKKSKPAAVAAAAPGGAREAFLQRDKLYKQRLKHIAKQRPQPYVVRGHQLQLQALTSVAHCHHCDLLIWGLAPQAYICLNCKLRVHRECGKSVEEGCVLDGEHHNNRISRFMERIHHNNQPGQDGSDKKSRKSSGTGHFLNMERSFRKVEDEPPWEQTLTPTPVTVQLAMLRSELCVKLSVTLGVKLGAVFGVGAVQVSRGAAGECTRASRDARTCRRRDVGPIAQFTRRLRVDIGKRFRLTEAVAVDVDVVA